MSTTQQTYWTESSIARAVRSSRRVESTNLIVIGLAVATVAASGLTNEIGTASLFAGVVVAATFSAVWAVTAWRSWRTGVRGVRIGYGALAVASVLGLGYVMLGSAVLGPLTIIGAGFVLIGWREQSRRIWITGSVLAVYGIGTAPELLARYVGFDTVELVTRIATVTTGPVAVLVLALGGDSFLRENREINSRAA
ncbi:hypothetical protein ABH922_002308 [Rhodococcus sp. 27YEA15]|uniref:hypothetical protein n=1 Tax=Rhodococcus sp. 27YEA15 TaxID=3156259 RepID=UPI003C7A321B